MKNIYKSNNMKYSQEMNRKQNNQNKCSISDIDMNS